MLIPERNFLEVDRFLSDLSAAWIPVRDAATLVRLTSDALAQHLRANRVTFTDVSPDASMVEVKFTHAYQVRVVAGSYSLLNLLAESARADLTSGRPVLITDVATDARTQFAADTFIKYGARAFV